MDAIKCKFYNRKHIRALSFSCEPPNKIICSPPNGKLGQVRSFIFFARTYEAVEPRCEITFCVSINQSFNGEISVWLLIFHASG